MGEALLKGRNICRVFGRGGQENRVLDHIDVEIRQGDFTMIMGPSGAGKSTLLYSLSAMDAITDGMVYYKGKEISRLGEKQMAALRAKEFGFVFQQTHLVSNLTLFENVAVAGCLGKTKSRKEILKKTERLLSRMHVEHTAKRLPHQVSGGEAQRAAIARAVIGGPGILFADEPTGALNKANSDEVLRLLTALNAEGQSILMVTHDIHAAVRGTRLLYLEDGRILDELRLPPFREEAAKEREEQAVRWLSSLRW